MKRSGENCCPGQRMTTWRHTSRGSSPKCPRRPIAAVCRRLDALFLSDGVRLALSGNIAPDFRRLQDEGCIVGVKCFGPNIPRRVRQLLQNLVGCDAIEHIAAGRITPKLAYMFCNEGAGVRI